MAWACVVAPGPGLHRVCTVDTPLHVPACVLLAVGHADFHTLVDGSAGRDHLPSTDTRDGPALAHLVDLATGELGGEVFEEPEGFIVHVESRRNRFRCDPLQRDVSETVLGFKRAANVGVNPGEPYFLDVALRLVQLVLGDDVRLELSPPLVQRHRHDGSRLRS